MSRTLFAELLLLLAALALGGCGAKSTESRPAYGGMATTISAGAPAEPAADGDYAGEAELEVMDVGRSEEMSMPVAQAAAPAPAPPPAAPGGGASAPAKEAPAVIDAPTVPPKPATGGGGGKAGAKTGATIAAPMLIYTADMNLAVFETEKILDQVERLAKDAGGYLVERQERRIVIRVPSRDFDGTMLSITKLGDVLSKNVSVQDVTEEFFDLQVRIRNLEVVRARMEELLKKADKVPDAIAVERELERVTSQLERLKGRAKLLSELVQFSTITVNVSPRGSDKVGSKVNLPFPWLNTLGLGELLRL
ncbi:MAG: DUF4349 domain-containing protein [Polyangiaceae bacterium]